MSRFAIACALVFCLTSCGKREPNAHQKLLNAAEAIVKQPQNWKDNSSAVVDFIKAAADAGISEDPSVLIFLSNATAMVTFGTKWTQSASSDQQQEYSRLVVKMFDQDKVSVGGPNVASSESTTSDSAEYENAKTKKKIVDLLSRYLDGSDSEEFQRKWESILTSYKELRSQFKNKAGYVQTSPGCG